MNALLRADWMRISRRRDVWAVGALLVILTALAYGFGLSSAIASMDMGPPGRLPVDPVQRLGPFAFPQSIPGAIQNGQLLLLALSAYLAAAVTAAEFTYGTIRTSLLARHDRLGFVVARLVVLGALGLAALLLIVALGVVMPAAATLVGADLPAVAPVDVAGGLGLVAASWALLLLVIVIATLAAFATGNAGAGLLTVGLLYGVEAGVANLRTIVGEPWGAILELLPLASAGSLVSAAITAATDAPLVAPPSADPTLALPVIALACVAWIVGIGALSALVLTRAEIDA